jgi:hypothetical protein
MSDHQLLLAMMMADKTICVHVPLTICTRPSTTLKKHDFCMQMSHFRLSSVQPHYIMLIACCQRSPCSCRCCLSSSAALRAGRECAHRCPGSGCRLP